VPAPPARPQRDGTSHRTRVCVRVKLDNATGSFVRGPAGAVIIRDEDRPASADHAAIAEPAAPLDEGSCGDDDDMANPTASSPSRAAAATSCAPSYAYVALDSAQGYVFGTACDKVGCAGHRTRHGVGGGKGVGRAGAWRLRQLHITLTGSVTALPLHWVPPH
jgi:hypothetical protein